MSRTYVKNHLDFHAIETDIATIEPTTITQDEVLETLAPQIVAAHRRGVTAEQIRDSLKRHRIQVSAAAITRLIEGRTQAPGKTGTQPATRKTPAAPGGRPGDPPPPG